MKKAILVAVYVWELPVRFYTGSTLARSWAGDHGFTSSAGPGHPERRRGFLFLLVRHRPFIHFAAAYIFFFNFLFRDYWGFAGTGMPAGNTSSSTVRPDPGARRSPQVDIFQAQVKPMDTVGHNALAGFTYFSLSWLRLPGGDGVRAVLRDERCLAAAPVRLVVGGWAETSPCASGITCSWWFFILFG